MTPYNSEPAIKLIKKVEAQFKIGNLTIDLDANKDHYTFLDYNNVNYPDCREIITYY